MEGGGLTVQQEVRFRQSSPCCSADRPRLNMAASSPPVAPEHSDEVPPAAVVEPFDFSRPPVIEGFTPLPRFRDETFKEKVLRKTKENPFVPIGQLHKAVSRRAKVAMTWPREEPRCHIKSSDTVMDVLP